MYETVRNAYQYIRNVCPAGYFYTFVTGVLMAFFLLGTFVGTFSFPFIAGSILGISVVMMYPALSMLASERQRNKRLIERYHRIYKRKRVVTVR